MPSSLPFADNQSRHPGGRDWLERTRGQDITEAYEVHHINIEKTFPYLPPFPLALTVDFDHNGDEGDFDLFLAHCDRILKKCYVKDINTPRNSPFTFEDDGFYRTPLHRCFVPFLLTFLSSFHHTGTLRSRVQPLLKDEASRRPLPISKYIADSFVALYVVTALIGGCFPFSSLIFSPLSFISQALRSSLLLASPSD